MHESLLDLALEHHASSWLIELSAAPLAVEDQLWLEDIWRPALDRTNVRRLAVVADDAYNLMVFEGLMPIERAQARRSVQFFTDSENALEWLTGSDSAATRLQREWEESLQPNSL